MSASVLRSMARLVSYALPDFELTLAADEATGHSRPWARIEAATPGTSTPHLDRFADVRRTYAVVAYPLSGLNPESSMVEAHRIEDVLRRAFVQGIEGAGHAQRRGRRSYPMRLPLFDYSSVGLREPATEAHAAGYAKVLDVGTSSFSDPADDRAYVCTADVRLTWNESVFLAPAETPLERVTVEPEA